MVYPLLRQHGDPETHRQVIAGLVLLLVEIMLGDIFSYSVRSPSGFLVVVHGREKKKKFFSAVAAEEIPFTDRGIENYSQLPQQFIAGFMTVTIIVILKPIHIAHHEGIGVFFLLAFSF